MNKFKIGIVSVMIVAGVIVVVDTEANRRSPKRPRPAQQPFDSSRKSVLVDEKQPEADPPTTTARLYADGEVSIEDIEAKLLEIARDKRWREGSALGDILHRIDVKDMPTILAYLEHTFSGDTLSGLRFALAEHWSRTNPAAAAAWCAQMPAGPDQQSLTRMIAALWAEKDPNAALQFGGPSPDVFRSFALRSLNDAADRALQLAMGEARSTAVQTVADIWFEKDPKAAFEWANSLRNADDLVSAFGPMMRGLADSDPAVVADYLVRLPPTERVLALGQDFAAHWARTDPQAAANWTQTLPESSPLKQITVGAVADIWTRSDSKAASDWISALPLGGARDNAKRIVEQHSLPTKR